MNIEQNHTVFMSFYTSDEMSEVIRSTIRPHVSQLIQRDKSTMKGAVPAVTAPLAPAPAAAPASSAPLSLNLSLPEPKATEPRLPRKMWSPCRDAAMSVILATPVGKTFPESDVKAAIEKSGFAPASSSSTMTYLVRRGMVVRLKGGMFHVLSHSPTVL